MPHPDSDAFVALLPHRPPFRFVDSVDQVVPASYIEARYRVTGDEEFLKGHFPGNPVLPRRAPGRSARAGRRDHAAVRRQVRGKARAVRRGGEGSLPPNRAPGRRALLVVRDREAERARRLGSGQGNRRRRNRVRSANAVRGYLTIRRSLRAGVPASRTLAPGEQLARSARLVAAGRAGFADLIEIAELAEVAGLAAVDVGEVGDASRGHLACHFLGIRPVKEQAGFHVAVERRFVAHAPPRARRRSAPRGGRMPRR